MKTQYAARKGGTLKAEDAKKVATACNKIVATGKPLSPSELLNASRENKSPTHHLFEWEDSVAAERFRLFQARNLINAVVEINIETKRPVKSFFSIDIEDSSPEYLPRRVVSTDSDMSSVVSARLYKMLLTYSQQAMDLGLGKDGAWKHLYLAIRKHIPKAAKE